MIKKILKIFGISLVVLIILSVIVRIIFSSISDKFQKGSSRTTLIPPSLQIYPAPSVERLTEVEKFFENPNSSLRLTDKDEQVNSESSNRLVVKTGTIRMVVKDINASIKSIIQYTESKGGWVVSSRITDTERVPSGNITVRVPATIFDEAMSYFKGLAEKISYEEIKGQDVTEEYIDLQSRLKNLESAEIQLLKIMERSGTIPDVLAVQRELTIVRGQIEQIKGRIQYLERNVEMATININLALLEELLPIPPVEKWRPGYVIKQAWNSLLGSLRSISYLLIWVGVYAIIWVPLLVIIWQVIKFWKRRKEINKI